MSQSPITCPVCQQSDQTYKVSTLYLEASARLNRLGANETPHIQQLFDYFVTEGSRQIDEKPFLTGLVRTFTPPAGARQVTRRLHPDLIVLVFTVIAMLLLYRMAIDQPESLPIGISIMVAGLAVYMATRKIAIRKFQQASHTEQEMAGQAERQIARWMQLYFCARNEVVFFSSTSKFASTEQISSYLRDA